MEQKDTSKNKRRLGMLITLLVNLLIVGYIALREFRQDAGRAERIQVSGINPFFLILGAACFFLALGMVSLKYRRMLMVNAGRDEKKVAFEVAALGKYYDNITPFGAGGQPFQILFLRKQGFPAGTCAALPIADFLTQQFAFVLIGIVVFIANRKVIDMAPVIRVSAYVGLLVYSAVPVGIVLSTIAPRFVRAVVGWVCRLLQKIHILKDAAHTAEGIYGALDEYSVSIRSLSSRPHFLALMMLFSLIYQAAILSVPFFMLRAFGGTGDWWMVFSLVVYIYAAITIVPTPGNAGAAEGSFYAVFASLESGYLFWAMIAWRLLVYYSWIVVGLIVLARSAGKRPQVRMRLPIPEHPKRTAIFSDEVVTEGRVFQERVNESGGRSWYYLPEGETQKEGLQAVALPGVRVPGAPVSIPVPRLFNASRRRLMRRLKVKQLSLIVISVPFVSAGTVLRIARKLKVPVAVLFPEGMEERLKREVRSRFMRNLVMNRVVDLCCRVDQVICYSAAAAAELANNGFRGDVRVMEA